MTAPLDDLCDEPPATAPEDAAASDAPPEAAGGSRRLAAFKRLMERPGNEADAADCLARGQVAKNRR